MKFFCAPQNCGLAKARGDTLFWQLHMLKKSVKKTGNMLIKYITVIPCLTYITENTWKGFLVLFNTL